MIQLWKVFSGRLPSIGLVDTFDSVYSVEQMRRVIDRERTRSDRCNSVFSLLTFTLPTPCEAIELAALARVFRDRLRITDDFGLLGPQRLGVVLPETHADGAWKVGEDLCRLLPVSMQDLEREVYTYPTQFEPHEEATSAASNDDVPTNGREIDRSERSGASGRRGRAPKSDSRGQSMHSLFIRPLPVWKRLMDVMIAAAGLAMLLPVLAMIAVAIKLTSPGPIFFGQQRAGLKGRQFKLYKFRTMVVGAEAMKQQLMALNEVDGPVFKIRRDPRLTRLGALLRKTSLDELPQFWNVLRGEMSLVGPRPPECKETEAYHPWQRRRLEVTPGLTCIWQVSGRCQVAFDEWVRMDLKYIRSRCLAQDVRLLLKTVPAVVSGRGAS